MVLNYNICYEVASAIFLIVLQVCIFLIPDVLDRRLGTVRWLGEAINCIYRICIMDKCFVLEV